MELTFIVGTGRCGSTLLSRILAAHPDVLSMSEFLGCAWASKPDFPAGAMDGRQLWDFLAAPEPLFDGMMREGFGVAEFCYPAGRGRFSPAAGIPRISLMTLPLLSGDPDALFDTLAAEVPGWPRRPGPEQVRALLGFLAGRLGRAVAVERSAASLPFLPLLHRLFPEARFVHLHRDGPDCALSLSRHYAARPAGLAELAGLLRWGAPELTPAGPPDPELTALLTPPYDVRAMMTWPVPLPVFGRLWSRMVTAGLAAARELPPGSWAALSYDDLLVSPERELTRLAGFLGVRPHPGWLDAARASIDAGRAGQAARLGPARGAALGKACEPGTSAIRVAAARLLSGTR